MYVMEITNHIIFNVGIKAVIPSLPATIQPVPTGSVIKTWFAQVFLGVNTAS